MSITTMTYFDEDQFALERFSHIDVRPATKQFANRLLADEPLTQTMYADFGIVSADHHRALRQLLLSAPEAVSFSEADGKTYTALELRICELGEACGNGAAITALVKQYVPEYGHLSFTTSWDGAVSVD